METHMSNSRYEDRKVDTSYGWMKASEAKKMLETEIARYPSPAHIWDVPGMLSILRELDGLAIRKYAAGAIINRFKELPGAFPEKSVQSTTLLREARMIAYAVDEYGPLSEWVRFGDFSRNEMGIQAQYGSRYLHFDHDDYPCFLENEDQIRGRPENYHSVEIHVDAIPGFLRGYQDHIRSRRIKA